MKALFPSKKEKKTYNKKIKHVIHTHTYTLMERQWCLEDRLPPLPHKHTNPTTLVKLWPQFVFQKGIQNKSIGKRNCSICHILNSITSSKLLVLPEHSVSIATTAGRVPWQLTDVTTAAILSDLTKQILTNIIYFLPRCLCISIICDYALYCCWFVI